MADGIELDAMLQAKVHELEMLAMSCVYVARDGKHVAIIALADRLRSDARQMVDELRAAGITLTLLSGSRRPVGPEAIARQLGGMEVIAEVLPQDKDRVIQQLQQRGECVAMVGDGINDAPALIRADVGIALGSGTDVSVESADIVLMQNELDKVRLATLLSRRTLLTIKQNIGLSFVYNSIMVPLAMMAARHSTGGCDHHADQFAAGDRECGADSNLFKEVAGDGRDLQPDSRHDVLRFGVCRRADVGGEEGAIRGYGGQCQPHPAG